MAMYSGGVGKAVKASPRFPVHSSEKSPPPPETPVPAAPSQHPALQRSTPPASGQRPPSLRVRPPDICHGGLYGCPGMEDLALGGNGLPGGLSLPEIQKGDVREAAPRDKIHVLFDVIPPGRLIRRRQLGSLRLIGRQFPMEINAPQEFPG